jgi:hypothetical protein
MHDLVYQQLIKISTGILESQRPFIKFKKFRRFVVRTPVRGPVEEPPKVFVLS